MHTEQGHRQRVKKRFLAEGLDNFDEVHALELLLFYALPRRDTKPVARRLLDKFGSFSNVLDADRRALESVEGVGPGVSAFLSLVNQTGRYYLVNRSDKSQYLNDLNECGEYLEKYFQGVSSERVYVLCLDGKRKVISCVRMGEGDARTVSISARNIVELAISTGAASVVLAHNHPKGSAVPSEADKIVTKKLSASLSTMGICLADHMIYADEDFTSMVHSGYYDPQSSF